MVLSKTPSGFSIACRRSRTASKYTFYDSSASPQLFLSNSRSSSAAMSQRRGAQGDQRWKAKSTNSRHSSSPGNYLTTPTDEIANRIGGLSISGRPGQNNVPSSTQVGTFQPEVNGRKRDQLPVSSAKLYGTAAGRNSFIPSDSMGVSAQAGVPQTTVKPKTGMALSQLFSSSLLENFNVDKSARSISQIRATFYPKFENEKSDQEVRMRMIEMVSKGMATLEVTLKHSGSLFMYAGHLGGAYAKNSFGNIYTAVGVFVLARMFREAWGAAAQKKQVDFNYFLEKNCMCISMELVTAVLGDHGQRPRDDYVVVTAVTELGNGKPRFYSTPELIAFCREWRLPTNHVWLFSSRRSVASFFATYDALCEEGTATPVCKALDEVSDISVPGSKDHVKVQGEILEGLVARIVSSGSSKQMQDVLSSYPPPPIGAGTDLGPSLRRICSDCRDDKKKEIRTLLEAVGPFCPDHSDWFGIEGCQSNLQKASNEVVSKFLNAHPADYSTIKVQEMINLLRSKNYPADFKCYHNFHKADAVSYDNLFYRMVIHIQSDSAFRRYQKEMRYNPGLWPLYRGFFVDINLQKREADDLSSESVSSSRNNNITIDETNDDSLADEDANLMVKLKFLTYKLRTFLIRNGLPNLFRGGPHEYRSYYLRQMQIWGTSKGKVEQLSKMLDEWAIYIRKKCGNKMLDSSIYLTEAEPFLEAYAKRSPANLALIGAAGGLVRSENFMAVIDGDDVEGDLKPKRDAHPSPEISSATSMKKKKGLIIFFPGIPGCAKSALCKELLNAPDGLGDERPVVSLMGDLIKGRYWQIVADERKKKPYSIMLADKNAPNEEVWRQIEDMCRRTDALAVPIVPDSEGTSTNPFTLEALAVFIFRVLHRVNHPGNLDKNSPNAGYVLLMFYHLYEGKSRKAFESDLIERFGALIKLPLLRPDRSPLPAPVRSVLEEGIQLYRRHTRSHGRAEPEKGSYANAWEKWERKMREVLFSNANYLYSIQVPFDYAVRQVLEQLRSVIRGEYVQPEDEKRNFGAIVFAAVSLPVTEVSSFIYKLAEKVPRVQAFLSGKDLKNRLVQTHVTLAHKRSHGVPAVASYGAYLNQKVPVHVSAFLFSDRLAALEAKLGSIGDENIVSQNPWPHVTVWTAQGVAPKEANTLPQMFMQGKATRVEVNPPFAIVGTVRFF